MSMTSPDQESPRIPDSSTPADAAVAPFAYEPPTLTPLGALHELLMVKTDGDFDFIDQGPSDPRVKV